ncbi:MAG: beta-galactosidase trimerization domain-containing protein [Pseudomonadota bacterium]
MSSLRFRQIHLDFHTAGQIQGIGNRFDPKAYAAQLKAARVDSVTTFARCHHGYSYYNTEIGTRHPELDFDLLQAQYDACKSADINVPIYLTVCWDELSISRHPEWRQIHPDGSDYTFMNAPMGSSWTFLCLNSPYLDYLVAGVEEVVERFPDADGIWLDIVHQTECGCPACLDSMHQQGLDYENPEHRAQHRHRVLDNYLRRTFDAVKSRAPNMPVFHNQGHLARGDRNKYRYYDHLEIESLPTGGWGYDHFPISAKYAEQLGRDYLGMTGKFHFVWGEFGGFKHPNALRYECAAMLAVGARCSVGDQLDPSGELDISTYDIIGRAYQEVEAKEPWCEDSTNVADVALFSSQAWNNPGVTGGSHRDCDEDDGAARLLLQGHVLFDVIDQYSEFYRYKLILLPDCIRLTAELAARLQDYVDRGGKLLLTGRSGLAAEGDEIALDVGAKLKGASPIEPVFVRPRQDLQPEFCASPFLFRFPGSRVELTDGEELGEIYHPWFQRQPGQFCGHQHAPARHQPSGDPCGSRKGNIVYLAQDICTEYKQFGAVMHKDFFLAVLRDLLGDQLTLSSNLGSSGRITLREQATKQRYVLHLLYGQPALRGKTPLGDLEVIEDLPDIVDSEVELRLPHPARRATLEPQGEDIDLVQTADGQSLRIPRFNCHQMIALEY